MGRSQGSIVRIKWGTSHPHPPLGLCLPRPLPQPLTLTTHQSILNAQTGSTLALCSAGSCQGSGRVPATDRVRPEGGERVGLELTWGLGRQLTVACDSFFLPLGNKEPLILQ